MKNMDITLYVSLESITYFSEIYDEISGRGVYMGKIKKTEVTVYYQVNHSVCQITIPYLDWKYMISYVSVR